LLAEVERPSSDTGPNFGHFFSSSPRTSRRGRSLRNLVPTRAHSIGRIGRFRLKSVLAFSPFHRNGFLLVRIENECVRLEMPHHPCLPKSLVERSPSRYLAAK